MALVYASMSGLPRTQTSLFWWNCARKGRREGDNRRDVASPAACTLPIVPCGSSPVTCFALASAMRKTKRLSRRLMSGQETLKVRKTRQQKKHSTCHATLLQNELYSNVARFTTNMNPVLQQIRLLTGLNVGGRTSNIAIQLVSCSNNVAKKVARFLLSVFPPASCELSKFI